MLRYRLRPNSKFPACAGVPVSVPRTGRSVGRQMPNSAGGLSLIELLIFSAIFALMMVSFISIFVAIVNVNARQGAVAEVNQQSQFLLQEVQYYTERASLIDMPQDTATTTIKLWLGINSQDPTYIYASGTTVYLKQTDSGTPQALTSSKVSVSNVSFVKHSNAPGHDSVSTAFTVAYSNPSVKQQFSQALQMAIARVSAATFDSNVIPSSTASYSLGTGSNAWTNINGVINFSGSNVGIGTASPHSVLEVAGGDVYIDSSSGRLVMHDPLGAYCWFYKPTTATGAWNISSSTCP